MSGNLIFGQDKVANSLHSISCDSNGHLDVNVASTTGSGLATEAKQDDIIADLTDGTQKARCMGSEDPNDPAATQLQLHLDGSGNVQTNIVNTVNIAPANSVNSGVTNDPANSVAVGLRARTDIADATTETFLKCDANGVLETSGSGGGGGGDATAANQSLQLAQETVIATNSSSIDNKMSQGSDATLTDAQQCLVYGRDSGGVLDALKTDASGHLEVVVDDFVKGQATMANSFPVVLSSDQSRVDVQTNRDEVTITQSAVAVTTPNTFNSTTVDMRGYTKLSFIGVTTNTSDPINLMFSVDDTTYYTSSEIVMYDFTTGEFSYNGEVGVRYVKLQQKTVDSAANMTITCISSKK